MQASSHTKSVPSCWSLVACSAWLCASACSASLHQKPSAVPVLVPSASVNVVPLEEEARENPPESDPARVFSFPKGVRERMVNGLQLAVYPSAKSPLVEVRLVLRASGSAADGEKTGTTALAIELLKEGGSGRFSSREMLERFGALGAVLTVQTTRDASVLGLSVPKDRLGDALALLGVVVREPRLDEAEFKKLKRREQILRSQLAQHDPNWTGAMLLWRELYQLPVSLHPYEAWDATREELSKVTIADVRAFVKRRVTPQAATLLVIGPVDHADVRALSDKTLGAWKGVEPEAVSFTPPQGLQTNHLFVVDHPGASHSDLFIGLLGPERTDAAWSSLAVAQQVLDASFRIGLDGVEPHAGAHEPSAMLSEVAHGPMPLLVHVSTPVSNTGSVLQAALARIAHLAEAPLSGAELVSARRALLGRIALSCESPSGEADQLAHNEGLGLDDDDYEQFHKSLEALDTQTVMRDTRASINAGRVIIAVADATQTANVLTRWGDVTVLDPERGFARMRTIPANPQAPLQR